MKIVKRIAAVIAVLIVAVLAFAATRPNIFRVERSTTIKAPPEKIFALVNDFGKWTLWSPYERTDPAMKRIYSGEESGKGAAYEWSGNDKAGAGRMEIIDSASPNRIVIKLDFIRPFEGHNTTVFNIEPRGGETNVSWAMNGPSPYMMKVAGLFMNLDEMIGKDFESGLANLKALSEGEKAEPDKPLAG